MMRRASLIAMIFAVLGLWLSSESAHARERVVRLGTTTKVDDAGEHTYCDFEVGNTVLIFATEHEERYIRPGNHLGLRNDEECIYLRRAEGLAKFNRIVEERTFEVYTREEVDEIIKPFSARIENLERCIVEALDTLAAVNAGENVENTRLSCLTN